MVDIVFNATDILKYARYYDELPKKIKPALANALNFIGKTVVDKTVDYIEQTSGLNTADIREMIEVHEATPENLNWDMDASRVAPPSLDWSRPWDKAQSDVFDDSTLVKIITMEDEKVCPICERAADESPYTLTEAQEMLPLHPNCRCLLQAFSSSRRLSVTFGRPGAAWTTLLTPKQIADEVSAELEVALKIRD